MDTVLLVEDNKVFGKLACNAMEELGLEVAWVRDYDEAAALIERCDSEIFLALLDLDLLDVRQDELVDLTAAAGIPSIVFADDLDAELRASLSTRHVIDYVLKEGRRDVRHVVSLVHRIRANRDISVLLVDDSAISRRHLRKLLAMQQYCLLEAEDGVDALAVMERHGEIRMVITDYQMPRMDGFELIARLRERYARDELAIIGLSAQEDRTLAAKLLKQGANDFIPKPFIPEEFFWRVTQNVERIERIRALAEAKEELSAAERRATRASAFKSEFLANMSHEIRTPMNAIVGFSRLAMGTELDPKQRNYLQKILNSSELLLNIINDILDFSKIEAGKLDLEEVPFDLDDVLENLASMISLKAAAKDLEIVFHAAPDVPRQLVGDPLRLGQILLNLCDNAIKFTAEGEVVVHVEASPLPTEENTLELRFAVRDTGIGLSEEQIGRLFRAFNQADTSTTRRYGGTGLGLTICKRLVRMMRGSIAVESEVGRGSTFSFTAHMGRQEQEQLSPSALHALRGSRVLVVDRHESSRRVLVEALQALSFVVEEASSGEAALARLGEGEGEGRADATPVALVFVDWRLPDIAAVELMDKLHAAARHASLPTVLMVAGHGGEAITEEAEAAGVDAVLQKPFTQSDLFDTIMEAFGHTGSTSTGTAVAVGLGAEVLQGARVLLVEDNEINQQVAQELLEAVGLEVILAANGAIAVETLEAAAPRHFHAVLMDLQMPVMDGYEATHKLRAQERFAELPIIAMTAHAMQDERDRCFAAGMNAHTAKPIDPEALFATLAEWIGKHRTGAGVRAASPGGGQGLSLPQALPGLDIAAGVERLAGNERLYLKLLGQLQRELEGVESQLQDILRRGDLPAGEVLAHKLKGVAGNLAARGLFEVSRDLEAALKHGDSGNFLSLQKRFDEQVGRVRKAITAVQARAGEPPDEATSEEGAGLEAEGIVEEITRLLCADDFVDAALLDRLRRSLAGNEREELELLEEKIGAFDYSGALETLGQLKANLDQAARS